MQNLWKTYRPFITFLGVFLGTYLVLSVFYSFYLSSFSDLKNQTDGFTILVSTQSEWLLRLLGYEASMVYHDGESWARLILEGKYTARIVEGCNALSVMILFVSFVLAFKGSRKNTLWFIPVGLLIIHLLNIVRIALFSLALRFYPIYREALHDIVFPLVIYGVVFILWVIWVQKFSLHAKNND